MTTRPSSRTAKSRRSAASNAVAAALPVAAGAQASQPMSVSYLIGQLDRIISRRLSEALSRHGLTLPQYTALSVLRARGRSSNAQIAERSFITPQAANEVIKAMEANGWVTRNADPMNRRIVLLSLSDSGQTLLEACDTAAERVETAMLDEMPLRSAQRLHELLRRCVRNLRAA